MIVGIISDSHSSTPPVRAGLSVFDDVGVDHIIHCGDVGGISVFEQFVGRPFTFVWGNCDQVGGGLLAFLHSVSITVPTTVPTVVTLGSRRIAVFHGHEPGFDRACRLADYDVLLHGHTHEARHITSGSMHIINPGALYNVGTKTVATLDLESLETTIHTIDA